MNKIALLILLVGLTGCVKSVQFRTAKNSIRQQSVAYAIERFESKLAHKQDTLAKVQERGVVLENLQRSQDATHGIRKGSK